VVTRVNELAVRFILAGLVGVALVSAATSGVVARQSASADGSPHAVTLRATTHYGALRSGSVDVSRLPVLVPGKAPVTAPSPYANQAQLLRKSATYEAYARAHPSSLPQAVGVSMPKAGANFVGGGAILVLTGSAEGQNYTTNGNSPDPAIAAAPGYVMEATDNTLAVYTPAFGIKYGPWLADSFFAPLSPTNANFYKPAIVYDAERAVFLIAWLSSGCSTNTQDCVFLAISKTSSPTFTNFYEYEVPISTDLNMSCASNFGDLTLGYDYWGMYLTCPTHNFGTGAYGNQVFAISLNNMLSGSIGTYRTWSNIASDVSCGSGCFQPATLVSATVEDGAPQAEWFVATDQGYGVTSTKVNLCALTNSHALPTATPPTFTCIYQSLPGAYADSFAPAQPVTRRGYMPFGSQQMEYRNGRLYFGLTSAVTCSGVVEDGILWAALMPQLTTLAAHTPQQVSGLASGYSDSGYWCLNNADSYLPAVAPSTEGDIALVYQFSSALLTVA
jgi:hypothetical protein